MCGICGELSRGGAPRPRWCAPWPGRSLTAGRTARAFTSTARRARPPAALDHRPLRGRQPADDQRGRLALARLQRRDLQLPRAAAAARGPPPLPEPGRHRGDPAPLRGEGRGGGRRSSTGCSPSRSGTRSAAAAARARPRGQEAALLPRRPARLRLRLRGEGALRAPRGPARARPRGAAALPDLRLRPDPGHVLPRDPLAAAGALAGGRPRRAAEAPRRYWRARFRAATPSRSRRATPRPRSASARCCRAPSSAGSWPTCRSARSSRAGSTRRPSWRSWRAPRAAASRPSRSASPATREYDEREHAQVVAERFGTEHTEFVVEPKALDLVDRLVCHHDGPFGDSSAVPTYLLSELTRSARDGGAQRRRRRRGVRRLPAALRRCALRAACRGRRSARLAGAASGSAGARRTAATRCASPSASPRRAACRSLERYLRWNGYFTSELLPLLQPELAAAPRARAAARELREQSYARRQRARRSRGCCSSTSRPTCSTTCS